MKLPEKLPTSLARDTQASGLFARSGAAFNYAISGLPFLSGASTENPLIRETAPERKEQFDNQLVPGEQTFSYWWLRSQQSFHGGAGQRFADPVQDNPFNIIRFRDSRNVDPWDQGEVKLLHEAEASGVPVVGVKDATEFNYGDGDPAVFAVTDSSIVVVRETTVDTALFTESSEDLQSVTTDGSTIFVAALDGLWVAPIPASYSSPIGAEFVWAQRHSFGSNDKPVFMAWVKSRIILGIGNRVYEITSALTSDGLLLTGETGDYASTPDDPSFDISTDFVATVDLTHNTWNPAIEETLASKYDDEQIGGGVTNDERSWRLSLVPGGSILFRWSEDGILANEVVTSVRVPVSSGRLAVRGWLDVDVGGTDHAVTIETAPTAAGPWSLLESIQDTGTTSVFNSTASLEVGTRANGTRSPFSGVVHSFSLLNGDTSGGTTVANPDFSAEAVGTEQFTDSIGNVWTINGDAEIFIVLNLPPPRFTHQDDDFEITGITETTNAILVVGNSRNTRGAILKFLLDETGEVPTLSAATVAAQLPFGEVPYSAVGYLGNFVGIGTNKGVRIGLANELGNVEYGPLLFESENPVRAWSARDRFLWCTVSRGNDGDSGLYRIDLGQELGTLRFAFATDLVVTGDTTDCNAIAHIGTSSKLFFATATDLYVESDDMAATGYLQTSRIRFNTLEPKIYKFIRVRGPVLDAPLAIVTLDQADNEAGTHTLPTEVAPGDSDIALFSPSDAIDFMSLRFDFARNATDNEIGPTLWAYQLKAIPASTRERLIRLPLLCFDWEMDRNGQRRGGQGHAKRRLLALEEVEREGNTVILQDFDIGENTECAIETVSFRQTTPPPHTEGWGGLLTVTLRSVR